MTLALILALSTIPTVGITQQWESYEYDYEGENSDYVECTVSAWTVEQRHDLPSGMTGWIYLGYIERWDFFRYVDSQRVAVVWWCDEQGNHGRELSMDDALCEMMSQRGVFEYAEEWK